MHTAGTEAHSSGAGGGYVLRISVVAALGGLLFGYDTAIISGAIPFIRPYFHLDEYSLGWAVSSILIGCGAGAAAAGIAADRFGRRITLMLCALLFALSGIGAGLSTGLSLFIVFRMAGGIGVGAAAIVSPLYIAETAPPDRRGRLVALYQLAIVAGILLAYLSNFILAGIGDSSWRWMFASQALPSVLFGLMLLLVPETPRWLVKKGRLVEARRILSKTMDPASCESTLGAIQDSFRNEGRAVWSELCSKKYLPVVTLGIFIAVFQQITGINVVLYYAPVLFKDTGMDDSASLLQTVGIGLVNVAATVISITLVDRIGRKLLLKTGSGLMGLSLAAMALCFRYHYFQHYVILCAMLVYVGAFGATWGAVAWVYLSEIFPNRIRGLAMSVATLALWLADFIVTYTFPVMQARAGNALTFSAYAVFCGAALIYVLVKIPETRGKSLEEMETLFLK
ncbi:sugar porter family MFS transporter [Compostibacter hankyongensis]|uniref:sugar porter family MFS transporter n=1 Tax=Compostibacter hankyongensis TaxID=1007089 RepID=UPI0031EA256B